MSPLYSLVEIYSHVPTNILCEYIENNIDKNRCVVNQQYEKAASLRDKEKDTEKKWGLEDFSKNVVGIYGEFQGIKSGSYVKTLKMTLREIKIDIINGI